MVDVVGAWRTTLSALGPCGAAIEAQAAMSTEHGERVAVQRLWCLCLAAAEGRAFADLLPHDPDPKPVLWTAVNQMAAWLEGQLAVAQPYEPPDDHTRRYVICLNYLPTTNIFGVHLHQVCCYATALALLPETEQVLVVATEETLPEGYPLWSREPETVDPPERSWRQSLDNVAKPEFARKIRFFSPQEVARVRPLAAAVEVVTDFRPTAIFYFLGALRSRLAPQLLKNIAPQIAVQFNAMNEEPTGCDLVLSQGLSHDFTGKPTPTLWSDHKVPVVPYLVENDFEPVPRLPKASVKIVTALSDGRVERALSGNPALVKAISHLLQVSDDVAWIFVGVDPEAEIFRGELRLLVERGQVWPIGFTGRLRSILAASDIYIHLPATGGGGMGIAVAVSAGLPVLVEAGTDATNFIGTGGVYTTLEELFERAAVLVRERTPRAALAQQQMRIMKEGHSLDAVSRCLEDKIACARTRFYSRLHRGHSTVGSSIP